MRRIGNFVPTVINTFFYILYKTVYGIGTTKTQ